jgi:Delta24-sterol reductase
LGYYPLWLCPLYQPQQWQRSAISCFKAKGATACPDRFMNLGIWGVGPRNRGKFIELNRDLEHKVQELKGKKWLYGHTYYTEEEFWNIYNRTEYEKLREKYHATYLPSVFDKVKVDFSAEENSVRRSLWARVRAMVWMIWPLRGLYGLFRASIGGDYLLPRYWWNRKS